MGQVLKHELVLSHASEHVRATLECCGGYTVTQADREENQSMNNQPRYNKGDFT